jgi:hypothetical protein
VEAWLELSETQLVVKRVEWKKGGEVKRWP